MFEIKKEVRDQIVNFLSAQVVSAQVGAGLMQVCQILNTLPEVKVEEEKK